MLRSVCLSALVGSAVCAEWEIVAGAVLSGKDFKNASTAKLNSSGMVKWEDCQKACGADNGCHSFDFVGAKISALGHLDTGISEGDCWFRLDNVWSIQVSGKRNHTSGRMAAPSPPPAPKGAKNVLFVLFDDLRAMHKTYGWSQPHLPNADKLMSDSLVLDRAYVQQAVCGPSRASILSGRRPDRTQMWNFIDGDAPGGWRNAPGADKWRSWPEYFASHGYYTAGTGKTYHRGDPSGFDPPSWTEPECISKFPFYGQGSCPYSNDNSECGCPVKKNEPACENWGGSITCLPDLKHLAKAKEFLGKAAAKYKKGQPFWLMVGFVKPHLPHIFPEEFLDLVPAEADIDLPPFQNFTKNGAAIGWLDEGPAKAIDKPASPESARNLRRAYYAAAAYSDSLLGELLDEVDKLGLREDTAVVLSADHGWGLGEHNHWIKYTTYETDTRVPLSVRAPWKKAMGKRSAALVEMVDLYPTLAELAGIPVDATKESIDGRSFAKLFDDPTKEHKAAAFSQYPRCWGKHGEDPTYKTMGRCAGVDKSKFPFMGYSMRTDNVRYTEWVRWDGKNLKPDWTTSAGVELYDHADDLPEDSKTSYEQYENENSVAVADKDVLKALSKQLRAHFNSDDIPTELIQII